MNERMTSVELRAGVSLAGVFGLRMLGLFFILPVLAVHAANISGGDNLTLVGIALGAYGLSQGILQIPFGAASDRWGRKPVLYAGLLIFAAGSFLGCVAGDIWTMIAARVLQGAGAISSVAMALAADLTREQHRTKVMAMIGSMIGFMFALSLVAAPVLYRSIGMDGLFALTGVLCLAAIAVVKFQVPEPPAEPRAAGPAGSLRAAINLANSSPGPDRIVFNIPGPGPYTIEPTGPLVIENAVTIDATTPTTLPSAVESHAWTPSATC